MRVLEKTLIKFSSVIMSKYLFSTVSVLYLMPLDSL